MNTIKSERKVKSDSIFGLVRRKISAWLGRVVKKPAKPVATVSCPVAGRTKRPETFRRDVPVNRKPTSRPVTRGTTFLVDTANLIGAPARRAGLYGCVDARLAAGDGEKALELLAQIARSDPAAYDEMSRICREGNGVSEDAAMAKRYARLAKRDAKAARQQTRRQKRQVANCGSGLDYANIRGAKELFLAHDLEECARRKAEGRKSCRRTPRMCKGHFSRFERFAA